MHFIKKFFKICLIILIIALVAFSVYRYYILKKNGKLEDVFAKDESNKNGYNLQLENSNDSSDSKTSSENDEKNDKDNSSNSDKFVVEEKNYDDYYNQFNFDNRLLLYEVKQKSQGT